LPLSDSRVRPSAQTRRPCWLEDATSPCACAIGRMDSLWVPEIDVGSMAAWSAGALLTDAETKARARHPATVRPISEQSIKASARQQHRRRPYHPGLRVAAFLH